MQVFPGICSQWHKLCVGLFSIFWQQHCHAIAYAAFLRVLRLHIRGAGFAQLATRRKRRVDALKLSSEQAWRIVRQCFPDWRRLDAIEQNVLRKKFAIHASLEEWFFAGEEAQRVYR